jgi:hypothetical protein
MATESEKVPTGASTRTAYVYFFPGMTSPSVNRLAGGTTYPTKVPFRRIS